MKNENPLILISNDDGVTSKGLSELIRFLRPLGDLVVMAPDGPQSGVGCAVSIGQPVHFQLVKKEVGLSVFKCTGTPADCVKLAFHTVLDRKPDLVVSGINHGDNSAANTHYSGTMGAVTEGTLKGVASIAFSACCRAADADFEPFGSYIRDIAEKVLDRGLPPLSCLNVNFPDTKDVKGLRVCEQAKGQWLNEWEEFTHGDGTRFYWMAGQYVDTDADNENNDHWALSHGYVAITPTTVDVTDRQLLEELKSWF